MVIYKAKNPKANGIHKVHMVHKVIEAYDSNMLISNYFKKKGVFTALNKV